MPVDTDGHKRNIVGCTSSLGNLQKADLKKKKNASHLKLNSAVYISVSLLCCVI